MNGDRPAGGSSISLFHCNVEPIMTSSFRLCPSDLKFMHEVGLRVPVVPVVTKADTMTIREAGIYRSEVANKIANPMLPGEREGFSSLPNKRGGLPPPWEITDAQADYRCLCLQTFRYASQVLEQSSITGASNGA
jgi:hypothetical protein